MDTIQHPTNDNDLRGIYEYLGWKLVHAGLDSNCLHYLEVLYNNATHQMKIEMPEGNNFVST